MPLESAADRQAFLADEGEAATWRPAAGGGGAILAIVNRPVSRGEVGGLGIVAQATTALVDAADVATPLVDDAIDLAEGSFLVRGKVRDALGGLWVLHLQPAPAATPGTVLIDEDTGARLTDEDTGATLTPET